MEERNFGYGENGYGVPMRFQNGVHERGRNERAERAAMLRAEYNQRVILAQNEQSFSSNESYIYKLKQNILCGFCDPRSPDPSSSDQDSSPKPLRTPHSTALTSCLPCLTQRSIAQTDKIQSLEFWIVPFTFSTCSFVFSISAIFFSYLLPSFTHSYKHLTTLLANQGAGPILVYFLILVYFSSLTGSTFAVISSFHNIVHGRRHKLQKELRTTTVCLSLLIIFESLVFLASGYLIIGMFFGFPQAAVSDTGNPKDPMASLEETLKPFITDKIHKALFSILKMTRELIKAVNLPTVEVEIEEVLQRILRPNAFYQASALVRIGKFLSLFFMFMLNFMLVCTTYWIFQFRTIIVKFMSMLDAPDENNFQGGTNEGMEDSRAMYQDRIVMSAVPASEEEVTNFLPPVDLPNHRMAYLDDSKGGRYFQEGNSSGTQSTPLSPENLPMINNIEPVINTEPTPIKSLQGIIEVPFISKSTDTITYQRTSRPSSRNGSRAPSRPMSRTNINQLGAARR